MVRYRPHPAALKLLMPLLGKIQSSLFIVNRQLEWVLDALPKGCGKK
jgi:hypothetical protein